ncbi:MAG: hypothetical protein GX070_03660 [Alcaligenaceae bacterium]|nr:hypothetical protein [Alcaligenaceae bacterium]
MAKSISTFVVKSLTAATAALAIGSVFSVASAQPQEPGSRYEMNHKKGDFHHKGHHFKKHHKAAIVIPGFGPASKALVEDLKLNDDQKSKLEAALGSKKELRKDHREQFKKVFELRKQQIDSGKLDPQPLLAAEKELREEMQKVHSEKQAQWLALWDTFSDDQKATVAKYYKERTDKWEERKAKREERKEKRMEKQAEKAAEKTETKS